MTNRVWPVLVICLVILAVRPLRAASTGDANNDGLVNAADVIYTINYLFAGGSAPAASFDPDGDSFVRATDVFYLINHLFAGGPAPRQPQPTITTVVDSARQVSENIDRQGGSIAVTGADGTVYTLTIPPGALNEQTSLALTPLNSASGLPVSGSSIAAVQMQPDGLRFAVPATLTLTLPQAPDPLKVFGFGYGQVGSLFRLAPLTVSGSVATLHVSHFSGSGIAGGVSADCSGLSGAGLKPGDRARQIIECVMMRMLRSPSNLLPADEDEITEALFDWYRDGVYPGLKDARDCWNASSCADGQARLLAAIGEFIDWRKVSDVVNDAAVDQAVGPLDAQGNALVAEVLTLAMDKTGEHCRSTTDQLAKSRDVDYLIWVQKIADLIGSPDPATLSSVIASCGIQVNAVTNGGFETGSQEGWQSDGVDFSYGGEQYTTEPDVRIVSVLGPIVPADGSFMAAVGTGLRLVWREAHTPGYSEFGHEQSTRLQQTFTVPVTAALHSLKFRYDVVTEEPLLADKHPWSDSICNATDTLEVALVSGGTRTAIVRPDVEAARLTSLPNFYLVNPLASTYHSGWRDVDFPLASFAGKQVILEIVVTDMCDANWDTVILIDQIRIE